MELINIQKLLNHYNGSLYPIFLTHNSAYKYNIFILEGDIIILTESEYDDTYRDDVECVRMTLITFDENNNYNYYHYNSIDVLLYSGLERYNEFYSYHVNFLPDIEKKEILQKMMKYYGMIPNITYYDIYTNINYQDFLDKESFKLAAVENIIKFKLPNTKKTFEIFTIFNPLITFLNSNKVLFDWEQFYIIGYKRPIILLQQNDKFILIEIKDFEETDDKIIDLRINNNPLEYILAYYNNRKVIISKTLEIDLLICEMLKINKLAKKLLNWKIAMIKIEK